MPALEEEPIIEVTSPDSSVLLAPPSSTSSDFSISQDSDVDHSLPIILSRIELPHQPTLKEIVINASGTTDLSIVNKLKLQVIALDMCLQHLSIHTPNLSELTLDGSVMTSLRDLGCDLKHLKVLRVARCGLTSLDGVFGLEHLEELYAGHNKIADLSPCAFLPEIVFVDLAYNVVRDITLVSFLMICPRLKHMVLEGNEGVTSVDNYREAIKEFLPNLESLDHVEFPERLLSEAASTESDSANNHAKRFLPKISTKASTSTLPRPASYSVSFPPKVLSPRPSSGGSSETISVKSVFPDIKK